MSKDFPEGHAIDICFLRKSNDTSNSELNHGQVDCKSRKISAVDSMFLR